jgi:hypothetical protein
MALRSFTVSLSMSQHSLRHASTPYVVAHPHRGLFHSASLLATGMPFCIISHNPFSVNGFWGGHARLEEVERVSVFEGATTVDSCKLKRGKGLESCDATQCSEQSDMSFVETPSRPWLHGRNGSWTRSFVPIREPLERMRIGAGDAAIALPAARM